MSEKWVVALLIFITAFIFAGLAHSDSYIPREAYQYRATLIREARSELGIDAPVALFAGQIHQESGWKNNAKSAYAEGLTQFTPATAEWISSLFKDMGSADAYNPKWAIRGLVKYDNMLYKQNAGAIDSCNQWAFALAGYNGGQGWNIKDRKLAASKGANPRIYWGVVEIYNSGRRADFFKENRGYPQRIILRHQAHYVDFVPGTSKVCIK